jgi:hypothetical protein
MMGAQLHIGGGVPVAAFPEVAAPVQQMNAPRGVDECGIGTRAC